MDRQAGFLLALLFLANFLIIQADKGRVAYIGHTKPFVGDPWHITCEKLTPADTVEWTRNGTPLQREIDNHELEVETFEKNSTLSSAAAKLSQRGEYKCTPDSTLGHVLEVLSDSTTPGKPSTAGGPTTASTITEKSRLADAPYVLKPNTTLHLECRTSKSPVYWQRNSQDINNDKDHYDLLEDGRKLSIKLPHTKSLLGNYTCKNNNSAPENLSFFRVIDVPQVILPGNPSAVEQDKLNIQCKILPEGLNPKITWVFGNDTYETNRDRVELSKDPETGVENVFLTVRNISMSDAGLIYCRANLLNVIGGIQVEGSAQFTVKDKLAALWPFLGICVEVIILCAIILIYEKKRNKAELEESDTDQSPDTKPTPNKDSDVRQRK